MLPMVNSIFGVNGIAGSTGFIWNGTSSFLNLLSHPAAYNRPYIAWFFIGLQLIFLTLGYFNIWARFSAILIYFSTANLFIKGGLFFTGGEVIVNILLFYMIFMSKNKEKSPIQNMVNNTAYYALLIQVCILYFFSSFFKLYDQNWLDGMALQYVSEISFYSTGWFHDITHLSSIISKVATYSVLLYQGLFPIVVWIKPIKIPFLIFGIILHLGIAFGMGIFSFGVIMIITYLLFLDSSHITKMTQLFKTKKHG